MLTRRFLLAGSAMGLLAGLGLLKGSRVASAAQFAVTHSDAEWRRMLSPAAYDVLRQSGTEAPFTSPLLNQHGHGIFACAGCNSGVFSSDTKFESGTGWPSFWAPLTAQAVTNARDSSLGMERTAVSCATCGGHLGHVFNDGPKPTGLRYCMNGVAMTFRPGAA
ncbi:MAG: peptide-methionine (R)-S-oxide reductase MsrB [Alphaproteobacteria bacterium]|nr:peptide-methionine (R)-S-oxide reductase MsrB [Alphaproteobacteria bacterium]